MRMKAMAVGASLAGLLTLSACTGGSSGGTGDNQPEVEVSTTVAGTDQNRPAPAAEIEGAQTGGVIRVLSPVTLESMDPTEAYFVESASILSGLVTRSLTQYVWDAETKEMVLVPDIATDLGTHNANFTKWTFTIRDDVRWAENGAEVTAHDVAYGIERSFDRGTFPEGASYSNDYFLDGSNYEGPYKDGTEQRGVVVDGGVITLKMARPFPDLPYWAASPAMGPIPTDTMINNPARYKLHPWSTGPYMFENYTPEKSLTLVKNPYWDPNTDPGRHQYVEAYDIQFGVHPTKIARLITQDSDRGDTLTYDSSMSSEYVEFTQASGDRSVIGTEPCTEMWWPDYREITDIRVRRAIAYAFPYRDYWSATAEIEGVTRFPATNVMTPDVAGRVAYNPLPDYEPGTTDTDAAHQLLEKANALGYELTFTYRRDDPLSVEGKDAIVASLTRAGFTTAPISTTAAESGRLLHDVNAPINVRSASWCSDWPSGAAWIPPLFGTADQANVGLGSNLARFSEKAVDDRIQEIFGLPLDQQSAAWNDLEKLIQEKYFPVFPVGYWGVASTHGSRVNAVRNDPIYGGPTWKDLWLTQ